MLKLALSDYKLIINGDVPIKEEIETVKGFEYKTKPFNHQIEAFKYGLNKDKWLLIHNHMIMCYLFLKYYLS